MAKYAELEANVTLTVMTDTEKRNPLGNQTEKEERHFQQNKDCAGAKVGERIKNEKNINNN